MNKIIKIGVVGLATLSLVACGNSSENKKSSSNKNVSSKNVASKSSSIKMTASEISSLQDETADSVTKSKYKAYASSITKSYANGNDTYHKTKISEKNTQPKKGDWQISTKQGLEVTYLSNLYDVSNQDIKGFKLFNTQYWLYSIDQLSKAGYENLMSPEDGAKPVFNSDSKFTSGDTAVFVTVQTDFKNTTDQTLTYDGLSGYAGGDYDFTTPDGKQYDREKIVYSDDTGDTEVQAGKQVEDKELTICLATGKDLKTALAKIPNTYLQIKTGGVETEDYDQLDGTRAIKLNLAH